jgi:uncharacterized protein (DUF2062 family)
MFGRRRRLPLSARLRQLVWPRLGWRRAGTYFSHRVRRLPGSPYSIAAGFACGAAISFTPLIGFHFALAALLSWLIGANLIAAAIGTVVGNPWTFPLIWVASYRIGAFVLGRDGPGLPESLTMTQIFAYPEAVLLPMMIGGMPLGVVAWMVSFWLVRRAVARYQRIRAARLRRRAERLGQTVPLARPARKEVNQ